MKARGAGTVTGERGRRNMSNGVKIHKANRMLQAKTGTGAVDAEVVKKAEAKVEEKKVDFEPMAQGFLDQMGKALAQAKESEVVHLADIKQDLTNAIMQLKANGTMFDYQLVSELADMLLSFIEAIPDLDNDVVDILDVNHKTLCLVVKSKMSGDGGQAGETLKTEIRGAVQRYLSKRK